jgi:hypothetical protein
VRVAAGMLQKMPSEGFVNINLQNPATNTLVEELLRIRIAILLTSGLRTLSLVEHSQEPLHFAPLEKMFLNLPSSHEHNALQLTETPHFRLKQVGERPRACSVANVLRSLSTLVLCFGRLYCLRSLWLVRDRFLCRSLCLHRTQCRFRHRSCSQRLPLSLPLRSQRRRSPALEALVSYC